jgi:hypothetical protein
LDAILKLFTTVKLLTSTLLKVEHCLSKPTRRAGLSGLFEARLVGASLAVSRA